MSSERLAKIDHVVERGISAGGYPGASVVVGRRGAAVWEKGFGQAELGARKQLRSSADRTIYDLASLTKVVGTTTALMVLFDEGKIQLDDPVSQYVPAVQRRRQGSRHAPHAPRASLRPAGRPRPLAPRAHAGRSARRGHLRRRSAASPAAATNTPTSAPTCSASSSKPRPASRSTSSSRSASSDAARHERHVLPPGRLAPHAHRADRNRAAARLSAPRRSARRERLRARRRRRSRRTVQHRRRPRRCSRR